MEKFAIPRVHTGKREGDEIQRLAIDVARAANEIPFFFGVRVAGVTFAAGVDQLVDHGLGRKPQGVLVLRDYGADVCTGVGEATSQPSDMTKQLRLRCPTNSTCDLWVF